MKENIDKSDYIKIKNICLSEDSSQEQKVNHRQEKWYLQYIYLTKDKYAECIKNYQINKKKTQKTK